MATLSIQTIIKIIQIKLHEYQFNRKVAYTHNQTIVTLPNYEVVAVILSFDII